MSSNLNALSMQRVCSTLASAYGVCVLYLSLEVLCVNSEEQSLVQKEYRLQILFIGVSLTNLTLAMYSY